MWDECNCAIVWAFFWHCLSLGLEWKLTSFQICWHIECSTFTASSFRIWNSSTGIPSPPLALFVVMLPKAHLTLHTGCLALGEWSHHHDYLGHEDLFLDSSSIQIGTFLKITFKNLINSVLWKKVLRVLYKSGKTYVFLAHSVLKDTLIQTAQLLQSCLTLCNPLDCSTPGSSVHGILQAGILGWVAISFSWFRLAYIQRNCNSPT